MDKGKTKYQQQQKAGNKPSSSRVMAEKGTPAESSEKARSRELADEIDGRFGFYRMVDVSIFNQKACIGIILKELFHL